MTLFFIILIIVILVYIYSKNKPLINSHKIPQLVKIDEENDNNKKLILSRELGSFAFNLFLTIDTDGKDLKNLKTIVISWSEWEERIFNFYYFFSDDNVEIKEDKIKIDIGSFNNCEGSKNFLQRTSLSKLIIIYLLDYEPKYGNFEYETDDNAKFLFPSILYKKELIEFKKGLHYLDS